jgi:hypothetical protein
MICESQGESRVGPFLLVEHGEEPQQLVLGGHLAIGDDRKHEFGLKVVIESSPEIWRSCRMS